tara:strand:+ start:231 stop:431 length:201 start_codon:yes stop_codon:yes gene_type:complete
MINTVYNVVFLLLGIYLIYCGFIGKELSEKGRDGDKNSKLFLSLMIIGGLIILYSTYKIYESIKGI